MKKGFWIFSLAVAMTACNNNETGNDANGDTLGTHNGHQNGTTNTTAVDTGNMAGQSMMELMQANMSQMKEMKSTGNPDKDYAAMMKVHHMGALKMAQVQAAKGTDAQLKQLAQQMITEQQNEINTFEAFISGNSSANNGDVFYKAAMKGMNDMKMEMDHSGSIDKQFAQMMIPHHQGAIDMSNMYLKNGAQDAKLKELANKIISDQQKEIKELQTWLSTNQ